MQGDVCGEQERILGRHLEDDEDRRLRQYLEDERVALFLQNEEFMRELQRNRDFLIALERGAVEDTHTHTCTHTHIHTNTCKQIN